LERLHGDAESALEQADVIVVTGGASVGEKDFAKAMFEPFGLDLIFAKVAIKPGKPVWLGHARDRLVMGLPGNPTSAMVTARLFLAPLLAGLAGSPVENALRWQSMPLTSALKESGPRETFHRARAVDAGAEILSFQDSSAQKALADADLLVRQRANAAALSPGDLVDVLDF
jgi:molybdopterin molybdotransferase